MIKMMFTCFQIALTITFFKKGKLAEQKKIEKLPKTIIALKIRSLNCHNLVVKTMTALYTAKFEFLFKEKKYLFQAKNCLKQVRLFLSVY